MIKSISFLLASILCAGSPLLASTSTPVASVSQTVSNSFQLGVDEVGHVRADYNGGLYSEFLKKMDRDYADAKKSNGLEGLIEIRKETARVQIHPDFAHSFRIIQEVRNNQLLDTIKDDSSLFSEKVRSAVSSQPTREENLISLYGKVPGWGKNSDENRLIEIDLEYYYKAIHLDADSSLSLQEKKESHLALEMDKMARMLKASQSFEDKTLQAAVEKDAATLDVRLARNYDMSDLNALGRGKIKPTSAFEEKCGAIISRSQGDLADLHRHIQNSIDDNSQAAQK